MHPSYWLRVNQRDRACNSGCQEFSSGLELIRKSSGQIINENISVRKLGEARTSLYEVIHRKNTS